MSLFEELKRRNVFRVGIAYAVVSWVLLQFTDVVSSILDLPVWAPKLVLLIMALGFVPALIFAWAFELTPEGLKKEKEVDRSQSITDTTGRKLDRTIIVVLVVAVCLLLVERFTIPLTAGESSRALDKSIAVLPFVNMSSDAEQDYFSDGISEEILNSLAAVPELKVAGRTSSFAFKGQNQDLRRIAETLGVGNILEGSVRKAGTQVRITAQLIKADDGFHLWSQTYDRELNDVFAIQDEIATEILRQLKARLLGEDVEVIETRRTDPEAYDLYLRAKQRMYSRTRPMIESAIDMLDRAIEKDPDYAPAWAQRGIATLLLSEYSYGTLPLADAQRQGKRFLDKALELDAELAEAWAGLGLYHGDRPTEHERAIEVLTKALSLNPGLIDASNWLVGVLTDIGDIRGALQIAIDLTERDPLYRPGFSNAVFRYGDMGRMDDAEALIERYRKLDPDSWALTSTDIFLLLFKGEAAQAFRLADEAGRLYPTDSAAMEQLTVARAMLLEVDWIAEQGAVRHKVDALDALGRRDDAFALALAEAADGFPEPLFELYNRAGRSEDLVNYVEERWPNLDMFASGYPHDEYGYPLMAEIALAYSRTGNGERFEDALMKVGLARDDLAEQGVDNWIFRMQSAKYLALAGDDEAALDELELAIDRGMQLFAPLADYIATFESLRDNPRFVALESRMIDNINADRAELGMEPVDPARLYWQ